MFSPSIISFHICLDFYDECLLAPVLPYRGDLHKAVHDIIRSVTPLKKIVSLYFFIKFEVPMLTALKYYNREASAVHRRTYTAYQARVRVLSALNTQYRFTMYAPLTISNFHAHCQVVSSHQHGFPCPLGGFLRQLAFLPWSVCTFRWSVERHENALLLRPLIA